MKLSKPLASLLLLASLSGCAGLKKVSDFQVNVTLPASGDCMGFNIISGKEQRLPADSKECQEKKRKSVWLDSENYKILRKDILNGCQLDACTQFTGRFDSLFLMLDKAAQKVGK